MAYQACPRGTNVCPNHIIYTLIHIGFPTVFVFLLLRLHSPPLCLCTILLHSVFSHLPPSHVQQIIKAPPESPWTALFCGPQRVWISDSVGDTCQPAGVCGHFINHFVDIFPWVNIPLHLSKNLSMFSYDLNRGLTGGKRNSKRHENSWNLCLESQMRSKTHRLSHIHLIWLSHSSCWRSVRPISFLFHHLLLLYILFFFLSPHFAINLLFILSNEFIRMS